MRVALVLIAMIWAFALGLAVSAVFFDSGAKVDLAPNGMAYCPTDASTPHPTPCMFRQP